MLLLFLCLDQRYGGLHVWSVHGGKRLLKRPFRARKCHEVSYLGICDGDVILFLSLAFRRLICVLCNGCHTRKELDLVDAGYHVFKFEAFGAYLLSGELQIVPNREPHSSTRHELHVVRNLAKFF